jgi:hypothetical protein
MPLPQPISCGNISHGIPEINTKMMPDSAARSGILGRPPRSVRVSRFGINGSIRVQSSSLTNGSAMIHLLEKLLKNALQRGANGVPVWMFC